MTIFNSFCLCSECSKNLLILTLYFAEKRRLHVTQNDVHQKEFSSIPKFQKIQLQDDKLKKKKDKKERKETISPTTVTRKQLYEHDDDDDDELFLWYG